MINYTEFIKEALAQENDLTKVVFKINAALNEALSKENKQEQLEALFDRFEDEWNTDNLTPEGIAGLFTWYIVNNRPEYIDGISDLQEIIVGSVRPYL